MFISSHLTTTIFWPERICLEMIEANRPRRWPLPSMTMGVEEKVAICRDLRVLKVQFPPRYDRVWQTDLVRYNLAKYWGIPLELSPWGVERLRTFTVTLWANNQLWLTIQQTLSGNCIADSDVSGSCTRHGYYTENAGCPFVCNYVPLKANIKDCYTLSRCLEFAVTASKTPSSPILCCCWFVAWYHTDSYSRRGKKLWESWRVQGCCSY